MRQVNLSGKTALVTGAGRGIGRAIIRLLAQHGATVIAAARTESQIKEVADKINQSGGTAYSYPFDLANESEILSLFAFFEKKADHLDILVNNAGIGLFGQMHEFSTKDLQTLLDVNIRGTYLCCREGLRCMIPNKSGYIINISSVVGFKGYPNQSAYTASKHAVVGMTKSLAIEAQPHNIRASVIHPGGVDTDLVRSARPDLDPAILIQPEDIAHTVMYLLSLSERCAVDEIYIRRRGSNPF
jgi:3-oxoacyl-[acyl-carrier protein] reductase